MDFRGGLASVVRGSSKAVWKTKRGPSGFLSKTLKMRHSSAVMSG